MTDQLPDPRPSAPLPGYAPYPMQKRGTNVLAILGLVGAFVFPLGGVICAHIGLSQLRRTGESGRGLAIAGLIIGYAYIAFVVCMVVLIAVGVSTGSSSSTY